MEEKNSKVQISWFGEVLSNVEVLQLYVRFKKAILKSVPHLTYSLVSPIQLDLSFYQNSQLFYEFKISLPSTHSFANLKSVPQWKDLPEEIM